MSAYAGRPSFTDKFHWTEPKLFTEKNIEEVAAGSRGVYMVRHLVPGKAPISAKIVYVGRSESCIRERLRSHFIGEGNKGVKELMQTQYLHLWFQYAVCVDPVNSEAWFISQFNPSCNRATVNPKDRLEEPYRRPSGTHGYKLSH